MKRPLLTLVALGACGAVHAQSWLDDPSLHVGGGFGSTAVDGTSRTTLQLFGGIDTLREGAYRGGIEVGVMDVSDSPKDLLWVAGVLKRSVSADVSLFGRAGLDFGNQAGLMAGAGVGYYMERNMEVRMEAVTRDMGTAVQFNLSFYPAVFP